jgi:hypothetical protein
MKGKRFIFGRATVVLSVVLFLIQGGSCALPTRGTEQASEVADLSNLDPLKQAFERDRGKLRIVMLLSPV